MGHSPYPTKFAICLVRLGPGNGDASRRDPWWGGLCVSVVISKIASRHSRDAIQSASAEFIREFRLQVLSERLVVSRKADEPEGAS